eukprot:COSAG04_NODE_13135_length_618_cov_1.601156_2_plen_105_part_00
MARALNAAGEDALRMPLLGGRVGLPWGAACLLLLSPLSLSPLPWPLRRLVPLKMLWWRRLRSGVPTEYREYQGQVHIFWMFGNALSAAGPTVKQLADDIARHLA